MGIGHGWTDRSLAFASVSPMCLADVSRQRGDQVGGLDDRSQPEKARQLQHHLPLDVLTHERPGQPVIHCPVQVAGELRDLSVGNQRADRDEAAVAERQT